MHCNGCQAATPEGATLDELAGAGWRVDELAATSSSPASRLYYCPRCAVELDHSRVEEPEVESVIEGPKTPRDDARKPIEESKHGKKTRR